MFWRKRKMKFRIGDAVVTKDNVRGEIVGAFTDEDDDEIIYTLLIEEEDEPKLIQEKEFCVNYERDQESE